MSLRNKKPRWGEEYRARAGLTVNDYTVNSVPYRIYPWVRVVEWSFGPKKRSKNKK